MIQLEDIQPLITWRPNSNYTHSPKSAIARKLKEGGDKAFDEFILEYLRYVADHPTETHGEVCSGLGCGDAYITVRKYITENPQIKEYAVMLQKSVCVDNVLCINKIFSEVLRNWTLYATKNPKLLNLAIEKTLTHENAKELGYGAVNTGNGQFVIINKTKPLPNHEDLSDV